MQQLVVPVSESSEGDVTIKKIVGFVKELQVCRNPHRSALLAEEIIKLVERLGEEA